MEQVVKFLKEAETYYLATVEGDQPRVRPFGTAHIFEGKLYIQTGKVKDFPDRYMQIQRWKSVRLKMGSGFVSQGNLWRMTAGKRDSLCLMPILLYRRCILQTMATRKCSTFRMRRQPFRHLQRNRKL